MEKKPVPAQNLQTQEEMGLEGWQTRDLILPQLKIRQPTSDVDEVPEGRFYNVLTNEHWEKVYAIFLRSSWGRIYYDRELGAMICKSINRIEPAPSIENPPSSVCATCEFSRWENNEPPKCREVLYNILLVSPEEPGEKLDLDLFSPYLMTVGGTSLRPMRAFVSGLVARRKPIYSVIAELSTEKRSGNVGKYYVLKVSVVKELSDEELQKIREAKSIYTMKSDEVIDASTEERQSENGEELPF